MERGNLVRATGEVVDIVARARGEAWGPALWYVLGLVNPMHALVSPHERVFDAQLCVVYIRVAWCRVMRRGAVWCGAAWCCVVLQTRL